MFCYAAMHCGGNDAAFLLMYQRQRSILYYIMRDKNLVICSVGAKQVDCIWLWFKKFNTKYIYFLQEIHLLNFEAIASYFYFMFVAQYK